MQNRSIPKKVHSNQVVDYYLMYSYVLHVFSYASFPVDCISNTIIILNIDGI